MQLYAQALSALEAHTRFAVAWVVRATGSTPQKAGAVALFEAGGAIRGTLGGGCLEAESRRRALDALDGKQSFAFDLSLNDDYGWDDGLICGGKVRVFVEPDPARHAGPFRQISEALARGTRGAFVLRIYCDRPAESMWVAESEFDALAAFPGPEALHDALRTSLPAYYVEKSVIEETTCEVYIEPVEPSPVLLIAGGGHVGQAVARLGAWLGFDVTVVDDRAPFTNPSLYPENVRTICGDIPATVAAFPVHSNTYIVIVTRGHRHDGVVLKECIHSPAAFIGMIGSRRKAHIIREGLIRDGIATEADFARVASPIGLDIGAVSVEEIGVSIASQLVAARRRRDTAGRPLSVYSAS